MDILLVDDTPDNLELLKVLLERQDHRVVLASNGEEALLRAHETQPDLVISDILMPVMDGFSLCDHWMKDSALCAIPFVFYTATYQADEDERFALSMGAARFLRKPMDLDEFLAQIQQILTEAREGDLHPPTVPPMMEKQFLKLYNERLIQKLDRRQAQLIQEVAALHEAEAGLKLKSAALEASPTGIAIMDRTGVVEWANEAFCAISGFSKGELKGKRMLSLRRQRPEPEMFERIWETVLAGSQWMGEIVNEHPDGSLHTAQTTITPFRNEHADITHFLEIMQDNSETKRVEAALRQSQKMEAVGRLAGGVAHDFNNMLSVILLNTEICLTEEGLNEDLRNRILDIQQATTRSAELTKQLLSFSRQQLVIPKRILPNEALSESLKLLQRLIGEDIELVFRPHEAAWAIHMDPTQLGQVLTNLVINARDAIADTGTISIETSNVEVTRDSVLFQGELPLGEYLRITVSDTGTGMDSTTLERIFEPYFTTKGEGKGTGLGLSIVYGTIKQNGGTIAAYSHPGVGTTMKVYLPRFLEGKAEARPSEEEIPIVGGTETVLLAEDEDSMREVVETTLVSYGYTVLTATSPLDVWGLAQNHKGPIHLLLTDVVMPGINGRELMERVTGLRPEIKVLFMSGYTGDVMSKRGLLEAQINFLQKPFRVRELAQKVRSVLDS